MKHDEVCGHDHDHDHDHDHGVEIENGHGVDATEPFTGHGVHFRFPRDWTVEEEPSPEQTTVTVQSPGTAFWTLSLFEDRPDPESIVASVMAAYEEMYKELDVYESDVQIFGEPAVARDIDFVCLDLVSSASLVAFQTMNHTVLVLFQGEDRELEVTRPLLEAMTRSLLCDLDRCKEP